MDRQENCDDEIVISGIGGHFPSADNLEQLKKVLLSNEVTLGTRWADGTNKIGKVNETDSFDNVFFGINAIQTKYLDLMQRLLLERVGEAIIDAGSNFQEVSGRNIAVLTGSAIGEVDTQNCMAIISGYGVTGNSRGMMANRISYCFNLKGISTNYDSNWVSGAEVLAAGSQAVRNGYCEAAVVTTANLNLTPEVSWHYSDMGLLSPDTSTRAFDADANGYVRSDGVVALYLQKRRDAKRVYATVVGAATRFDGLHNGPYIHFSRPNMTSFLRECYQKWNFDPNDVDYVECYGCGIKAYDEVELNSIDEVFCKGRKDPLKIGSVKTILGHCEASSITASLAKILVAMETGQMPATLQYSRPNPNIPGLTEGRLEVVTKNSDWNGVYAAVNGFGLSGSYAHCLLKINNVDRKQDHDLPMLVVATSRTESGIESVLETIATQPKHSTEYLHLAQCAFSKTVASHLYRGYTIVSQKGQKSRCFERYEGTKRPVWFVYSGMGSQWNQMGKDLMKLPLFADTIERLSDVLRPRGVDLIKILTATDTKTFDNILNCFVGIAAVQIALTDLLKAVGVVPDGIIGHSVGELGCAYADGCLTAEQMILSAYSRGKASNEAPLVKGMMAAVGLGYDEIKDRLPDGIEAACHNSETSCTISGEVKDMETFVARLQAEGIFARLVNVANIAYHSKYIQPAGPLLLKYLREIIPVPTKRSKKWISTSVPESKWKSELAQTNSAEYHTNNLLSSVLFEEGSKHVPKNAIVVEIAPHGLLQAILKTSLGGCNHVPLTKKNAKDGLVFLLDAIGSLHIAGLEVNLTKIYPKIEYPVARGTANMAALLDWNHDDSWPPVQVTNYMAAKAKCAELSLHDDRFKYCLNNNINSRIIVPVSAILDFIVKVYAVSNSLSSKGVVVFENVRFRAPIEVSENSATQLFGGVQKGTGNFQITADQKVLVTGRVRVADREDDMWLRSYRVKGDRVDELAQRDFYAEFEHRGHDYQGLFRQVRKLEMRSDGTMATLPGNQKWQTYLESAMQMMMFRAGEEHQDITCPTQIERINISFEGMSSEEQDVTLEYHYATDTVSTRGLQVSKATFETLPRKLRRLNYEVVDVMPLSECPCETMEKVLQLSVNLILENFVEMSTSYIYISQLGGNSLIGPLKQVVEKYGALMFTLDTIEADEFEVPSKIDPFLIVSDRELGDVIAEKLQYPNVSALVRTSQRLVGDTKIVTVASFTANGKSYSLIRKKIDKSFKAVSYTASTLTASDLMDTSSKWHAELSDQLQTLQPQQSIYLVSTCLPEEGMLAFVRSVRAHIKLKLLKYIFVLEEQRSDIANDRSFYDEVLGKNLHVTVFKGGKAGTCISSAVDFNRVVANAQCLSNNVDGVTLEYVGVHEQNGKSANVNYVGKAKDGGNVMGIARVDPSSYKIGLDSIFRWNVPSGWSPEAACTVPNLYTLAYYSLVHKLSIEGGQSVLLDMHYGDFLLASIKVAMSFGCRLFVTVAEDWEKGALQKEFPNLNSENILPYKDNDMESQLKQATNERGVKAILTDRDPQHIESRSRCVDFFGKIVYLGHLDLKTEHRMGMIIFLDFVTLTSVIPDNIANLADEDKRTLHHLVQKGIDGGVVKPTYSTNGVSRVAESLRVDVLGGTGKVACSASGSYVIVGESQQMAVDLVEWLALRGARKVFLILERPMDEAHLRRRVHLLASRQSVEVRSVVAKVHSAVDAGKIIATANSSETIRALFNTGSSDRAQVALLLGALRAASPQTPFVNFDVAATLACWKDHEAGHPTYNIEWGDSLKFRNVIDRLDDVVVLENKHIAIKDLEVGDIENEQSLYRNSILMLPSSPKELAQMAANSVDEPQLLKLFSFGPDSVRELPPVILVPGFSTWKHIDEFASKLDYPVFCTALPDRYVPIKEAAVTLAKKIQTCSPEGPYNVVGISCGGILAIEIAKHLQKSAKVQMTLVDGAPDTTQTALALLGNSRLRDVNLLGRIFDINNPEMLKILDEKCDFDSCFEASCELSGAAVEDPAGMKETLLVLRRYLNDFVDYTPHGDLLEGEFHLVRPKGASKLNDCGLRKYFKEFPRVILTNGDHLTLIKSNELIDFINTNVALQ